jgi:hypothetical protein
VIVILTGREIGTVRFVVGDIGKVTLAVGNIGTGTDGIGQSPPS